MIIVVWKKVKEVGCSYAYILNLYLILTQTIYIVLIGSSYKVIKIAEVKVNFTGLVSLHLLSPILCVHFEPPKAHKS